MRLNFFDHRTLFLSPNCQFQSNCAHFWLSGSTLAVVVNKIKKMDWRNHFGQVLSFFKKIIRARSGWTFSITKHCFGHQIVNFSRICVNLMGRLHISHKRGLIKNWTERTTLDKFYLFPKKYLRSIRLNFFDHKHCFGHQIVNFSRICVNLMGRLHISRKWGLIKKWTERTTLDKFYLFPKKVSALDEA